jgi:hypothetical protein
MTSARRSGSTSASTVIGLLLLCSPVLVPAVLVLGLAVMFVVLIVVQAFGAGFAEGCAALSAVIGVPSLGLLWLSAVLRARGHR